MNKKIVIYTNKTCQYCDQVKKSLTESSIEFTEIDIIEYKDVWSNVKDLTATPITPTIKINNEFLLPGRDFVNPQSLIEIISNFKESIYSENRRTLELVKTLNYNTFTAFNRLSAVLQQIENKLNTEENEHKSTS
jgi:glutaredoxin